MILVTLGACGSSSDLPDKWTLSGPGVTVEVARAPYTITVRDGVGHEVLASRGAGSGDGYGSLSWSSGSFVVSVGQSGAYFNENWQFDPWRDDLEATAATVTTTTLDLVLKSRSRPDEPAVMVHHELRASTLRVEAKLDPTAGVAPRVWAAAFISPGAEGFLGMGERFTRTNFRGISIYNYTEEGGIGGKESDLPGPTNPYPNGESQTYFPIPFFLSTRGYGFWLDSTWYSQMDFASDKPDAWRTWHVGPTFAYEVFLPIPADERPWPYHIIDLFTARTGRPMTAPPWAYGPRRRASTGDRNPAGDLEMVAMRDQDLAITTLDDANHFLPRGRYNQGPALMAAIQQAHGLGYRTLAYFNPFFSTNTTDAIYPTTMAGEAAGYFIVDANHQPSQSWIYTGGVVVYMDMLDFTNPAAAVWYTSLFDAALALGYDGWMYDFAEYIQPDAFGANGMGTLQLHNLYPVLYAKAAYDKLQGGATHDDWLLFARAGYTGSAQYLPMFWSGDPAADFDSADGLPSMVRAAVNLGVSGVPNWGGDIGGYHCIVEGAEKADGELLTRWIEQGAALPDMHDENACVGADVSLKATIWTSSDAYDAWKTYARLHTRLFPYLYTLAQKAHETGAPIVRHPFLDNPSAPFASVDDAYYLGPNLYAAPVVARGARQKDVLLPPGQWLDFQAAPALVIAGGAQVTLDAPLGKLPLLLRDGGLVPLLDPTIDTLSPATDPSVVDPGDVADRYDVLGFVTAATRRASFSLYDGGQLVAVLSGAFVAPPLPPAANVAELATCAGCWLREDLGNGLSRVRVSATGNVTAGGLQLTSTVARRIRWDLYLIE